MIGLEGGNAQRCQGDDTQDKDSNPAFETNSVSPHSVARVAELKEGMAIIASADGIFPITGVLIAARNLTI